MATEFEFTQDEFLLDDVKMAIETVMGEKVAVVAAWPAAGKPGRLRFERDVDGDQPPLDLDPVVVQQALAGARQKERQFDQAPGPTPFGDMLTALRSAQTDGERWAVLDRLLDRLAQRETGDRQRAREERRAFRQARRDRLEMGIQMPQKRFVSPRDRDRPGVLFTRAQRVARARERRLQGRE